MEGREREVREVKVVKKGYNGVRGKEDK